jgi:colicin import membrane protein
MASTGLLHDIKKNPVILGAAIGLHVVVLVLLSISLTSSEVPKVSAPARSTVKAVVVDEKKIEAEINKLKKAENKEQQKKLAQQKKIKREADKARKKLEAEKKKLAMLRKKQAEEKKKAEAERRKREAERKKREAEKKRLEQEEEKRRQQEDADLKRRIAEEERREEEARLAAEHEGKLKSLRSQYVKLIEQKVERNWLRPVTSTSDMSCEVIVNQTSLGDVVSVKLQDCSDDQVFQRSVERAVRKASPLPPPPSPEVFDREIHFTFRPRT